MRHFKTIIILLILALFSCKRPETIQELPSKYITTEKVKIHYKEYGKGNYNLVFIHGWGCDLNVWNEQFAFFSNKSRMIFIDLPGYGESEKPNVDYTLDFFAESVKNTLDDLKITNPVLIGHSLGTAICRQLIFKYPNLNAIICDIDGVYCNFPSDSLKRIAYFKEIYGFTSLFTGADYNKNVSEFVNSLFYETTSDTVKKYALSTMCKTLQYVGESTMKNMVDEKYWDKSVINVPALVVCSKNSYIPDDNENFMKTLYSNMQYYEFDKVGHFIMIENPQKFNSILFDFLESVNCYK
jgi:pimeloyl-ACP methyl ester carboxylesterase